MKTREVLGLKRKYFVALLAVTTLLFALLEILFEVSRLKINPDDAIRWTLWVAVATVVSATGFSLIQQQEEFQKKRAEEEKEQALRYQSLEQRLLSLQVQVEAHAKIYGHEGVYELLGRVIQVESDHKSLLVFLDKILEKGEKNDDEIRCDKDC